MISQVVFSLFMCSSTFNCFEQIDHKHFRKTYSTHNTGTVCLGGLMVGMYVAGAVTGHIESLLYKPLETQTLGPWS